MPGFVAGNHPADPGQVRVAVPGRHPADVAVRDACRALLERGVDEQVVGIGPALRVEAIDDEGVHGPFDRAHVHAAGETEVGVEQVAVPVLLGRPSTQPSCPGSRPVPSSSLTSPLSAIE